MQERWQSMKMWISQGRALTRQEVSCMWEQRLVLLSGPCAVQKNVGGGVDSGLRAPFVPPITCFDAHAYLFTIWTCYKYFSPGLAICILVLKRFELLLCFGFSLITLLSYYPFLVIVSHAHLLTSCFLVSHLMYRTSCISIFRF